MNNKGFTLVEFLACLALLGIVMCIGIFVTRDTLATSLSTLSDVSVNEIYSAAKTYVIEERVSWINYNNEEYTCLTVNDLVDNGYLRENEVKDYADESIKVIREPITKVINSVSFVDICE